MAAGKTPDEIREAMDDRERDLEIAWVKRELTSANAESRRISAAITKTRTRLNKANIALGRAKKRGKRGAADVRKQAQVVAALRKKERDLLEAQSGVREWIADLKARALELDLAAAEDAIEDQGPAGGDTGGDPDTTVGSDPNLQAIADQANRRAEISEAGQLAADQFIRTALGPGDLSRGGLTAWQAAGGTLNVNVQTLHPGDPATLQAIIEAIARAANQSPAALAPGGVLTV